MADISTSVYEFDSVVRGHHIYKTVWTQPIDEMLQVAWEDTNKHSEVTVTINKGGYIVGHNIMLREILRVC